MVFDCIHARLQPCIFLLIFILVLSQALHQANPISVVLWTLHLGPKPAILASSSLILIGNWIRYAGARSNTFGVVMFGQILIGLAQPFVLAAPTRYSDLWFTDRGRISATAVASLANPLGGAVSPTPLCYSICPLI